MARIVNKFRSIVSHCRLLARRYRFQLDFSYTGACLYRLRVHSEIETCSSRWFVANENLFA